MAKHKKRGGKGKKLTKRQRSARKAARTRKEKHLARSRAAKRGAKKRKRARKGNPLRRHAKRKSHRKAARKHRRRRHNMMAYEKKKPAKKRKPSSKKKKKKGKHTTVAQLQARLQATRKSCGDRIVALKKRQDKVSIAEGKRNEEEIKRLQERNRRTSARLAKIRGHEGETIEASERRHRRHHRKHRRHGRKRNPILNPLLNPIKGWGEGFAAASGVVVGGLFTVVGDRFAATRPLTDNGNGTFTDTPATSGDVYDVSAPSLPIWTNIKSTGWKRILNAALNMGLPLVIGGMMKDGNGKTFFQLWGYTAMGYVSVKVTTDVAAKLFAGKVSGMRLFAPESTAQSQHAASLLSTPGSAMAQKGQGLQPSLTGYGSAGGGCSCGGCGTCASCCSTASGGGPNGIPMPGGPNSLPTPSSPNGLPPSGRSGGGGGGGMANVPSVPVPGYTIPLQPSGGGGTMQQSGPGATIPGGDVPRGSFGGGQRTITMSPQGPGLNTSMASRVRSTPSATPTAVGAQGAVIADATAGAGRNNITSARSNVRQIKQRRWG